MKKRRALLLTLLALLLVVGMPMGFFVREYWQEQINRALIAAIKADDNPAALSALKAGADPDTRDYSEEEPLSFSANAKRFFKRVLHPASKDESPTHPTALRVYLMVRMRDNPELARALLNAGANPNLTGDYPTYIVCAVVNSQPQTLRLLLQHGDNAPLKGEVGPMALVIAARYGDIDCARQLLDAGVDVNFRPFAANFHPMNDQ